MGQFHNVLLTINNLYTSILMELTNVTRIKPPHSRRVHLQYNQRTMRLRTMKSTISNMNPIIYLQNYNILKRCLIIKHAFQGQANFVQFAKWLMVDICYIYTQLYCVQILGTRVVGISRICTL